MEHRPVAGVLHLGGKEPTARLLDAHLQTCLTISKEGLLRTLASRTPGTGYRYDMLWQNLDNAVPDLPTGNSACLNMASVHCTPGKQTHPQKRIDLLIRWHSGLETPSFHEPPFTEKFNKLMPKAQEKSKAFRNGNYCHTGTDGTKERTVWTLQDSGPKRCESDLKLKP